MTGLQIREARKLLGWTVFRLASHADIPPSAVYAFERTNRMQADKVRGPDRVELLQTVLEAAGIEISKLGGGGPGVRLRLRKKGA